MAVPFVSDVLLDTAVEALLADAIVVVPTETVYGAATLASSKVAVQRLLAAKERPPTRPLPVMAPSVEVGLSAFADGDAKARAHALAHAFWPGPLTIVAPLSPTALVAESALCGQANVGVRVCAHPVTERLLKRLGRLVVCPSANRSERPPATRANEVDPGFLPHAALLIDGGPGGGVASTVVDVSIGAKVLREGPLSAAEIETCLQTAGLS